MVYKVMQHLTSMVAATGAGATQEQRSLGRPSTKTYVFAQPSPPPWPRGPMACSVLYSLSTPVCVVTLAL